MRELVITKPLTRGPDVHDLQVAINKRAKLTSRGLVDTDSIFGKGTLQAARREAYTLGLPDAQLTGPVRPYLQERLLDPRKRTAVEQARGKARFIKRRLQVVRENRLGGGQVRAGQKYTDDRGRSWPIDADDAPNLVWFDGKPVAKWIAPSLAKCRATGRWQGRVNNGWRSYAHQYDIYYVQRIRPAALPGRSNHQGSTYPRGAVDVSDPGGLRAALNAVPGDQHLVWYGPGDPWHFSATGR